MPVEMLDAPNISTRKETAVVERTVRFTYPKSLLNQPLIHGLIRQFNLYTNITEAQVTKEGGYLIVLIRGSERAVQLGLDWMESQGVVIEILSEGKEEA